MEGLLTAKHPKAHSASTVSIRCSQKPLGIGLPIEKIMLGDRCFYGGIDVQETLPWGTEESSPGSSPAHLGAWQGRRIPASSSHRLEHDVPVENTLAMIDEAHEYGVYPLPEQPPEGADVGDDLPELQR